jgi:hypothetical protein
VLDGRILLDDDDNDDDDDDDDDDDAVDEVEMDSLSYNTLDLGVSDHNLTVLSTPADAKFTADLDCDTQD